MLITLVLLNKYFPYLQILSTNLFRIYSYKNRNVRCIRLSIKHSQALGCLTFNLPFSFSFSLFFTKLSKFEQNIYNRTKYISNQTKTVRYSIREDYFLRSSFSLKRRKNVKKIPYQGRWREPEKCSCYS